MLIEETHRLRRVEYRAAADRDDEVWTHAFEYLDADAYERVAGFGYHVGEDVDVGGAQVSADVVDDSTGLRVGVGHDHDLLRLDLSEVLDGAGVEVGVRRHAEPLRRRTPSRDGLDVEEVAVVDVVGGVRSAPRAAAEGERGRHRVVDAAEGADGGRGVDEDAARAHDASEPVDHLSVVCVDGGGVPEAAMLRDEHAGVDRVLLVGARGRARESA